MSAGILTVCFGCLLPQLKAAFWNHFVALGENEHSFLRCPSNDISSCPSTLLWKDWIPSDGLDWPHIQGPVTWRRWAVTPAFGCWCLATNPPRLTVNFTQYWPHWPLPYSHTCWGIPSANSILCGPYFIWRKVKDFMYFSALVSCLFWVVNLILNVSSYAEAMSLWNTLKFP